VGEASCFVVCHKSAFRVFVVALWLLQCFYCPHNYSFHHVSVRRFTFVFSALAFRYYFPINFKVRKYSVIEVGVGEALRRCLMPCAG